jgi:hypothetical protein
VSLEVKKMCNKELHELYSSPDVVREMHPGSVIRAGLWSVGGRREMHAQFWWGNPKGREHFEDLCADWRIILKWIFKK